MHNNFIGEKHYDPESSRYNPQSGDVSGWIYEPNKFTSSDHNFVAFIKKNTVLFILCCVILAFLIITLICLCVYLKRKSDRNKLNNLFEDKFKDKMTNYDPVKRNFKVQ